MEDKKYMVWQRKSDGAHLVATIQGNVIEGPSAEMVRRILKDCGWPEKGKPDELLHGMYVWAEEERLRRA